MNSVRNGLAFALLAGLVALSPAHAGSPGGGYSYGPPPIRVSPAPRPSVSIVRPTLTATTATLSATNSAVTSATNSGRYIDTKPAQLTDGLKTAGAGLAPTVAGHIVPAVKAVNAVAGAVKAVGAAVNAGEQYYDKRNAISNENQKQMEQQLIDNQQGSRSMLRDNDF
jgi:hypothetical protein